MNILKKLTKADLKQNKKRTVGTLIGIILATALITVVGGMFAVLQNTLLKGTIQENGYYHIVLNDISDEQVKTVALNKDFSNMEIVKKLGEFSNCVNENACFNFRTYSMNKDSFDYLKYNLIEGTYPKNNDEILIPDYYSRRLNTQIGDSINVLNKTYKVVGKTNGYANLITVDADIDDNLVYLTLKNPKNYVKDISELLGVEDYRNGENAKYAYSVNTGILRWEVFAFGDDVTTMLKLLVSIIIGIILVTSIFSIRNSFAISISEKLKTFGMLSAIGATKKQIRRMVLFEGLCLGVIGISIGLIFGGAITFGLTWLINEIAASANLFADGLQFYYKFVWYPYIVAIIVGFVMIYFSTLSSSIKASHVSPIQNIRNSGDIKNPKKLRVPFFIRKIFKVGGTLSYKNLKRSKKKYRVTVISLTVSILVFIVTASFMQYTLKEVNNEIVSLGYDVVVNGTNETKLEDTDVKTLAGLADSHLEYEIDENYKLYDLSHIVHDLGKEVDHASVDMIYYDADSFKEICKKLKIDYESNKDRVIILDNNKDHKKEVRVSDYKKGDTITLDNLATNDSITYKVAKVSDIRTWGSEFKFDSGIMMVMNSKYYKGSTPLKLEAIYYTTDDADKLIENAEKISDKLNYQNVSQAAIAMKTLTLIFSIFIYGFIIVISLIGITSVFNTINSNMELRKSDFATLKSVGMTKREFNRMILLEAVFYSFKSLFFGLTLGMIGSYFVYKAVSGVMDFGYTPPIGAIIISIVFVILLVYIIMRYSIGKVNKQNIIETIRNENI